MTDDDLIQWIDEEIHQSKIKTAEWRSESRECYSFYAGDQWSVEDKSILDEQGRPAVVFNRIARTINAIAGLEVQNRQEVRFIPRELSDTKVNEVLGAAVKWVRDNCDAEDEESEAFQDTLTCGMGWTCSYLDYEIDPDGSIIVERDDPLYFFWDAKAKKRNLDDTRWRAKVHMMSRKDIKERWPKWDGTISNAEQLVDEEQEPHDSTPPFYDNKEQNKPQTKDIEVLCFEWYDKESFARVQMPDGRIIELTDNKFNKLKASLDAMGTPYVQQKRRVYKKAWKIGKTLLEKYESEIEGFTYNCITGLRDRNTNTWFGIVNLMIDPQRWANKWLSQVMHILNSNSKGGLLAEQDAFADPRKAEREWSDPKSITWLAPGGMNKIQQKTISQMPTGIEGLLRYALESINDVPGVNTELLGLADRNQPGVLETSRKQAGVTMLAVFFDSLRRYRKEQGRVLAAMTVEYIADGRLIRIVGDDGAEVIPLLKDQMTFKYDVVVDDAPSSPNQKEKSFAVLMQVLPAIMQAGVPVPPEVIDYMPLPSGLVEKWKAMVKPPSPEEQQAKEQQEKQAAMEAMQMQAQSEAMREQAKGEVQLQIESEKGRIRLQEKQLEAQAELVKAQGLAEIESALQERQQAFDEWKTKYEGSVKITVAQIGADSKLADTAIKQMNDVVKVELDS